MEWVWSMLNGWALFLGALTAPLTAIIVTYIAVQQYKLKKFEVRKELYDRRVNVFRTLKAYLAKIKENGGCEHSDTLKLPRETAEAQFLFDRDVTSFIEQVYEKSLEDLKLARKFERATPKVRGEITPEQNEVLDWLHNASVDADRLFEPYLRLRACLKSDDNLKGGK